MTNELIKDRINSLETNYKNFVISTTPTEIVNDFANIHKFDEEKTIVLENGFALYLLFFFDENDFVNFIVSECGLRKDEAETLLSGLELSLPEDILQAIRATQQVIFSEEGSTYTNQSDPNQYVPKDQENTFTSMQSTILQDNKNTPIPPPSTNS